MIDERRAKQTYPLVPASGQKLAMEAETARVFLLLERSASRARWRCLRARIAGAALSVSRSAGGLLYLFSLSAVYLFPTFIILASRLEAA